MSRLSFTRAPAVPDPVLSMFAMEKALRSIWSYLDEARAKIERFTGQPVCVESCGSCCLQMTPEATALEAEYLARTIMGNPNFEQVRERALTWLERHDSRLEDQDLRAAVGVLERSACPFLGADMRCMIYAVRPLACRAYGVTAPADTSCPRPLGITEHVDFRAAVSKGMALGARIQSGVQALYQRMQEYGRPDLAMTALLPMLLAQALDPQRALAATRTAGFQVAKLACTPEQADVFSR